MIMFNDQQLPSQDLDVGAISDPLPEDMVEDQVAAAASESSLVASPSPNIESREDHTQGVDAQASGIFPEVSISLNIVRISLIHLRISYEFNSPHGVGFLQRLRSLEKGIWRRRGRDGSGGFHFSSPCHSSRFTHCSQSSDSHR